MKAYLSFNLNSPEDKERFEEITGENHVRLKLAMWNFSQDVLRKMRKYHIDPAIYATAENNHDVAQLIVDHIETEFYNMLNEQGARIE